jgi:hypothetical protein
VGADEMPPGEKACHEPDLLPVAAFSAADCLRANKKGHQGVFQGGGKQQNGCCAARSLGTLLPLAIGSDSGADYVKLVKLPPEQEMPTFWGLDVPVGCQKLATMKMLKLPC